MKPLDSDKKVEKRVEAPAEATQTAPVVEEKIDFSNVQIEPLFADQVDFDTFSKSDFRAVKVKQCTRMTVTSVTALSRECSRIPATLIPVRTKPFGTTCPQTSTAPFPPMI